MIASQTEHQVTCLDCQFRKTLPTMQEAKKIDLQHKGFHRDFAVGTRVLTPILKDMKPTQPGTIEIIYSDWEEVLVVLDEKGECYECSTHRHIVDRSWRGKLSEIAQETR